jgi:glycosyltransferase involved in cell wall biosynthesis
VLFSGHDMKFVYPFLSQLKASGHEVIRDEWDWGAPVDIERTKQLQEWADSVFCEWGLANAVWHSQNAQPGKPVFIRIHLQEIGTRAKKFGHQIQWENVEKFIFVSARVRDEAMQMFGWPAEKTVVIPNFVLPKRFAQIERSFDGPIRLGMVGIIPQRKRFDRAVDLLEALLNRGHDASLEIKGPRPETIEFMRAPGRKHELVYYEEVYKKIDANPDLSERISFSDWGNDMPLWYGKIDHILSPSDFESFHYALADGVLSGCQPILWPWEEATTIYTDDWLVATVEEAANKIEEFRQLSPDARNAELQKNRTLVIDRYGNDTIYDKLSSLMEI